MTIAQVPTRNFLAITREERFFCTLLTHALLVSEKLRAVIFATIQDRTGVRLRPESGAVEIYTEVAWLRDHWRQLGNPAHWTQELEEKRLSVLSECVTALGVDFKEIEHCGFLRTSAKKPKVVSPGKWPLAALASFPDLKQLKWAFNSRPDFLLVDGGRAVVIEAKLESKPSHNTATGYDQEEVQTTLCELMPIVASYLEGPPQRMWIVRDDFPHKAHRIRWAEIADQIQILDPSDLDEFTRLGLLQFSRNADAHGAI